MQHGSRPWIGRQLSAFVALAVGEEDLLAAGRVQPRSELTQRVGIQICDIHPPSLAPAEDSKRYAPLAWRCT